MIFINKIFFMKNLFVIAEEEKNRILGLHETATKNQYLINEQEVPTPAANILGLTNNASTDNQTIAMEKGYGPVSQERADELASQGWPEKPATQQKTLQTANKKTTTDTQSKYAKHLQNVQNVQNKLKEIDPSFAPTSKDKMDQATINKIMNLLTQGVKPATPPEPTPTPYQVQQSSSNSQSED
jgi:hypothetical protein